VLLNSVLGAVLLGVAVTAVLLLTGSGGSAATTGGTVRSATAQLGDVTATVSASGPVSPVRTVDASFAASGTIATVDVTVGQVVTAGQRLGTLDTGDAQTALDQAETQLSNAEDTLAAAKTAATTTATGSQGGTSGGSSGGSGGGTSVTSAQSQVNQAQAAVDSAQKTLDETTLSAPIAGLVTAVNGTVGDRAGSGSSSSGAGSSGSGSAAAGSGSGSSSSAFVTIADTSAYVVSANVAESDVAKLQVGQSATIAFPAVSGASGTGTVSAIAPVGTTSSNVVTFPVTVTLAALPDGIRLGQTAQISVTTASATNVLEVPSAAVRSGAGGTHSVTVLGTGTSRTVTTVAVGVVGDTTTQVTSGLKAGDKVLISVDSAISGTTSTRTGTGTGFGGGGFGGGGGGLGGGGFGGGAGRGNG
jgi:macrolide-specific efflux system membrane fusion protein